MQTIIVNPLLHKRLSVVIEHCILAVAFFLPLSLKTATVFLAAGAICWLVKAAVTGGLKLRRSPFDGCVALFVVLSGLSVLSSPNRDLSFYNYYHLMGRYILIYYLIIYNVRTQLQLKKLLWTMFASGVVVVLYGLYQYIFGIDITAFEWVDGEQFPDLKVRVFSTLENPNLLAGYLVIAMAVAVGAGLYSRAYKVKLLLFAFVVLCGVCLTLTYSRGAWLSVLAVMAVYGSLYKRRVLWLLLVPVAVVLTQDMVLERILSIANPTDTSSTLRIALWESTLAMIVDYPLRGIGWGAYYLVYPQYDFFIQDAGTKIFHAHNTYLHIAAETGIPGLAAFLAIMVGHIRTALILAREKPAPVAGVMMGIVAAMWGLGICGLTDHVLFNIQLSMLYWTLNAIVISVYINHCSARKAVQTN